MAGRPKGSRDKRKAFRNALRMELAAAGEGSDALRAIVQGLIGKATHGDLAAIREIADRLDGRPGQAAETSGELAIPYEEALAQLR
jgi:hypothetical protein